MSIAQPSYPVSRSGGVCAATGRAFAPGEEIVAALVEVPGSKGLQRIDYALTAWEGGARPAAPAAVFGFWRARFAPAASKPKPIMSDDELRDLFEELAEATEPRQIVFRYVLALLLIRRRVLRLMGSRPGVLLVLPKGVEGEPQPVTDPGMDEAAVADAIEQVSQVITPEAGGVGGA
jgi:hypothetical protein